jgi:hypothetical protein
VSIYALVSPGGSPGVTTTALALALGWPRQVILAECDPSGGDILAGLFAGHLEARSGLVPLALEAGQNPDGATAALWSQLIALDDERGRLLLAGISDPRQGLSLAPFWPMLTATLAAMPADVIADCGRLDAGGGPEPVLTAASRVALVLRPSLRQVSRARARIDMLAQLLGGPERITVLLVGEGSTAPREVSRALGVPVAFALPHDEKTASLLSDGAGSRRAIATRPLIRAAGPAGRALREPVPGGRDGQQQRPAAPLGQPVQQAGASR